MSSTTDNTADSALARSFGEELIILVNGYGKKLDILLIVGIMESAKNAVLATQNPLLCIKHDDSTH